MRYSMEQPKEHDSAYFVQDRDNTDDISRLSMQEKILNSAMGGVLPELDSPAGLHRVLDVGCGLGAWLIETARTYPTIERLVGADVSGKMLSHARASAHAQGMDERVTFQSMDALRRLEFPAAQFDLLNQRAGMSWLRVWEWKKILAEYHRVTRAGGTIRITEPNVCIESNSPALTKLCAIALAACRNSGRLFTSESDGVTGGLVNLMTQHAIDDVQYRAHPLVFQGGSQLCQDFARYTMLGLRVSFPFFQKWISLPPDYHSICQQAEAEMQGSDFLATWTWVTAWGKRPLYGEPLLMRGLR
jgi:ubiquinone/menaquinone biosynthesis C-methylase UbiE